MTIDKELLAGPHYRITALTWARLIFQKGSSLNALGPPLEYVQFKKAYRFPSFTHSVSLSWPEQCHFLSHYYLRYGRLSHLCMSSFTLFKPPICFSHSCPILLKKLGHSQSPIKILRQMTDDDRNTSTLIQWGLRSRSFSAIVNSNCIS